MAKKIVYISKEQAKASQKELEEMMKKDELGKEQLDKLEQFQRRIIRRHKEKEGKKL